MHGLAVYVKEGLLLAQDFYLEKSVDSYLCLHWLYFTQCLNSFSFIDHLCHYAWFLILLNITNKVLLIERTNVFASGDWLTYSGGTDRPGELCYNFLISNDLTQMVRVLVCVLQWLPLYSKILIMMSFQFPMIFHQFNNRMPHFITQLMTILVLIGTVFMIIWEMRHFFNCDFNVLQPTLGHSWRDNLTNPMLITAFVQIWPQHRREPCNDVASLSLAEYLVGFELDAFQF